MTSEADVPVSSDHVLVRVRPNPFREETRTAHIPAGRTISEALALAGLPPDVAAGVQVDGVSVPRARWDDRPRAGQLVTARAVPAGSDDQRRLLYDWHQLIPVYGNYYAFRKDPKTGSILLGSMIQGALGWLSGGPVGFIVGALSGAYNGYAYARMKERADDFTLPENRGSYAKLRRFISGGRNELRPYGVVPYVMGYRVRYRPPYAARPYSSWLGGQQIFYTLMTFGRGPVRLENLKLGDTPIANLGLHVLSHGQAQTSDGDRQIQVREGWGDDDALAYFLDQIDEQTLAVRLSHDVPNSSARAPWSQRRTESNISRIGVEVSFPRGLRKTDPTDGSTSRIGVDIDVQYKLASLPDGTNDANWHDATGKGVDNRPLRYSGIKVDDNRGAPFNVGITFDVDAGEYDVRLRRKTADRTGLTLDESWWGLMRVYRLGTPIRLTGLCTVAMQLTPSRSLSGEVDSFNAEASFMGPWYDDVTAHAWVTPTRSSTPSLRSSGQPAAHFRSILCGPANRAPLSTSRLDLTNLAAWAALTESAGLHFGGVIETGGTVYDTLNEVASYGRASYQMRDGLHGVVADVAAPGSRVQVFTPREYDGFSGSIAFPDAIHALTVEYVDTHVESGLASVIVYDDNYNADGTGGKTAATLFTALSLVYCQDRDEAWKHGRRFLAERRLRRKRYTFDCMDSHIVCTRGDLVELVTEELDVAMAYGRVTSVALTAGAAVSVTFDEAVTIDSASSYLFRFRKGSGVFLSRSITTPAVSGDYTTLTFAVAIPSGDPQPEEGDLFEFATTATTVRRCLVWSIEHRSELRAHLTLIDEAPDVYTADAGSSTAFNNISRAPGGTDAQTDGTLHVSTSPRSGSGGGAAAGIVVSVTSSGRSAAQAPLR